MPSAVGRMLRWGLLLALALVAAILVGGYVFLIVDKQQRDSDDRSAAEADPRFQRPLVATSGRILFVAQRDQTDDFYVVNVDGSGLTRLTHMPRGWELSGMPVVSPDGSRLAINTGKVSIVRLDRPGEALPLDRAPLGSLAWSPDGTHLASLSIDFKKRLHLYEFNADGDGAVLEIAATWPLTADGFSQSVDDLAWSPDGKLFAFTLYTSHRRPFSRSLDPQYTHTYIAPIDGRAPRNLSVEPNPVTLLGKFAWSPDSRRLAGRNGEGIAVVDVDLKWKQIPIFAHMTDFAQRPAWSPDGQHLAWFNPDSIVVSNPDGGQQQELTRGRCRGVHPSWSDDGRRIAFACYEPRGAVFVMNADGSGLTSIHVGPEDEPFGEHYRPRYPVWLPALAPRDK
jgi:Tol biopolymer transport system component